MTWISYHTGYAGAPFTDRDVQRWAGGDAADDRRKERKRISNLRDQALADMMADNEDWLRSVPNPGVFTGYAARMRMARHEAIVMRGWNASDPRVCWEPRGFAGPLDEAAHQAGMAADGLHAGWHDSLYPTAAQAEAARQDAVQACGLAGGALLDLDRARGTLARLVGTPAPAIPGYPQGELAEAARLLSLAAEAIRARAPVPPAQGDTPAVAAARRFRDACSGLVAVLDSSVADLGDAGEALAKISVMAERVTGYASCIRDNLREWAPPTFPNELVTRRDWDPAAGRELAAAWQALNAWHQIARAALPWNRPASQAGRVGFPTGNPLTPPGPGAAVGQRTSPATAVRSRVRRQGSTPGRR